MSFAQDNGYTPQTFDEIISAIRIGINSQFGTNYTAENFEGTGWYKYAYAITQRVQEGEIKTSEIFQKLQEYISLTNERIQRPSVSHPGLIESFESNGFLVSVKPIEDADAGKIFICVDLDDGAPDYAEKKLEVATLMKDFITGGLVSQGSETEDITLSNGQQFTFRFNLPDRIPVLLRMTLTESENNVLPVPSDEDVRIQLFQQINERYRLGLNFEPQRYFSSQDAPWAETILLEWSDDAGNNWNSTVFDAEYTELFEFELEDIQVLIQ